MDRETIDRILPDGWELQGCWEALVKANRGDLAVCLHIDETFSIQNYDHLARSMPTFLTADRLAEIPQVIAALRIARDVLPAKTLPLAPEDAWDLF